jgi:hypothetical protein
MKRFFEDDDGIAKFPYARERREGSPASRRGFDDQLVVFTAGCQPVAPFQSIVILVFNAAGAQIYTPLPEC